MAMAVEATRAASRMSSRPVVDQEPSGTGHRLAEQGGADHQHELDVGVETRAATCPTARATESDDDGRDGIVVVGDGERVVRPGVEVVERDGGRQRGDGGGRPPAREADGDDRAGDQQGDVGVGHAAPHPHEQGGRQGGQYRGGHQPATGPPAAPPHGQPATPSRRGPTTGRLIGESLRGGPRPPATPGAHRPRPARTAAGARPIRSAVEPLGQAEPVAGVVPEQRLGAVGAFSRLLHEDTPRGRTGEVPSHGWATTIGGAGPAPTRPGAWPCRTGSSPSP